MSTRNLPGVIGYRRVRLSAVPRSASRLSRQCVSLDVSLPYGPRGPVTEITLLSFFFTHRAQVGTNFADKRRSLSRYILRSRTKATELVLSPLCGRESCSEVMCVFIISDLIFLVVYFRNFIVFLGLYYHRVVC
jgi:hypothetical protein